MTEVLTAVHELMLMRSYVNSGATRSFAFRKQQLLLLRDTILENEKEIYAAHSILAYRMNSTEPGTAMPELARTIIHKEAVSLIVDWINKMKTAH